MSNIVEKLRRFFIPKDDAAVLAAQPEDGPDGGGSTRPRRVFALPGQQPVVEVPGAVSTDVPPPSSARRFALPGGPIPEVAAPAINTVAPQQPGVPYEGQMVDPTATRARIDDPRQFLRGRVADEQEEVDHPVNRNSRAASFGKSFYRTYLDNLSHGGGLLGSLMPALVGGTRGAIDKSYDEKLLVQKNLRQDQGRLAQYDSMEDAALKRMKTRADLGKTVAETNELNARPGERAATEQYRAQGRLMSELRLLGKYDPADPQYAAIKAKLEAANMDVPAFDNSRKKTGANHFYWDTATGTQMKVDPEGVASPVTDKEGRSVVDETRKAVKVGNYSVLPNQALNAESQQENRSYARAREESGDEEKRTGYMADYEAANEAAQIAEGNATTEEGLADAARQSGDDIGYQTHLTNAAKYRSEATSARREARAARGRAQSTPDPVKYRRRSGGSRPVDVDLGKYGLNP